MIERGRLPSGGQAIDRADPRGFTWNGEVLHGYGGDTLASALLANGKRTVGRSFKYHRRRGIVAAGAEEPNAIVQVGRGARTVPNLRATQVELFEGLHARSVNCWPNLEWDVGAVNGLFSGLMPAGFYYKTFKWPGFGWQAYEWVIRRAAGLGRAPEQPDPDMYEHRHAHCDVLVVGAGPAGLAAALAAARRGARVIVVDEQAGAGGSALHLRETIDGLPAADWAAAATTELCGMDDVDLRVRTTAIGLYHENFVIAAERLTDHVPEHERRGPRERLWRIRARRIVLATGAIERSLVFGNNDLPGVMQADALSQYLHRYGVAPGRHVVVFTNNDSAYRTALDCKSAGLAVRVVDVREQVAGTLPDQARDSGINVLEGHVLSAARGRRDVAGAEIMRFANNHVTGAPMTSPCDLIACSGGWSPALHLHSHAGGRARYDGGRAAFVPDESDDAIVSIGGASGEFDLSAALKGAYTAGSDMARATVGRRKRGRAPDAGDTHETTATLALWRVPEPPFGPAPKAFVDLQNDTAASDLELAVREGYASIEHVKRYTALGFGTDQGKLGNINGMGIVADALGVSPEAVGTTTFRPPYTPVSFGAVAGEHVGALFDPVRKTPIHAWHEAQGAEFEVVGQWLRPWYYPRSDAGRPAEDLRAAVNRECLAARRGVAMMDASTLGKIDVRGPDAPEFLDRIYTNGWKKLAVGRARYGLMLGEDGMVMDDGVSARIADDRYYMTTTTGGAAHVLAWMERWLQTEWPELKVWLTSVTDAWATVAVVGPDARNVLRAAGTDIDLDSDALPFMAWRGGHVAGLRARVFRVSFSGELAFEVNVAADHGLALWEALFAAGEGYGITPYGTEAMHVLRAEKGFVIVGQDTDGSVTPMDLGMDWIIAGHKDFLGKRSLSRADCVRPGRKQLVGLLTRDAERVLPEGAQLVAEPFSRVPAAMLGHVTSSYWSPTLGRSIALALVKDGRARTGGAVHAALADGTLAEAVVTAPVFYDPKGVRMHG